MPSITDKLKRLGVQVGTENIPSPGKAAPSPALVDVLQGSWVETSRGECFVVRKKFPLPLKHGSHFLNQKPELDFLDHFDQYSGISDIPFEQFLFIDTETTGLSGGAGTYVFLVGAAKVKDDGIHFSQFFLQDPSSEPCQLAALEEYISDSRVIVSYNGKSFDLPRIRNRFLFHGWPAPFQDIYHIDLLHLARRLWKNHLSSCSLGEIEYQLLGLERSSQDIPGWQVSEKFFEYLQHGDPAPLEGVFYHNEVDVISLISLLGYISDRLRDPLSKPFQKNHDLISIGVYLSQLNRAEQALDVLHRALRIKSLPQDLLISGLNHLALIHKGMDNHLEAVASWKKSAELGDNSAKIELAKYYEHKAGDYDEALHWTLSAITAVKYSTSLPGQAKDDLEQRLRRLKNKLGRRKQEG